MHLHRYNAYFLLLDAMVMIAGYEVMTTLHESGRSSVYRGQRSHDEPSVILKVMQAEYPTLEELSRYRLEYEILNRLSVEGIPKAHGLEKYQNGLVLILEDFGGESLRRLMRGRELQLTHFLQMAIALSDILSHVHAANIIHKDINPANIILNQATGNVGLIDFGNSTVLSRENPTLQNPNVLEGTLAYISPEQTGRMNRSLDYRTDFYSLGATFYELLTGTPPFTAANTMELVHYHLARQPEPLDVLKPEVPPVLSQIVLKLLAKNAEDRYQSAYGLKADLQHCLNQLQGNGWISPFELAKQDASGRFQIPQKLYGREREVAALLAGFERVSAGAEEITQQMGNPAASRLRDGYRSTSGLSSRTALLSAPQATLFNRSELMLVAGYSGIGKSALVQEIYKPITRHNGYFISGKFDQFQRNVPYFALIQAFQELIRQLLTESQEQISQWRSHLLNALGMNGQVVSEVIPEITLIIGEQPPVLPLAPKETQNRFNLVFQNFIKAFTQPEHPLVIFLDDLQWADFASLKLLEMVMSAPDSQHLLLVGAYRSNEVNAVHPLMVTVEEIRKAKVTISQIDLTPLEQETVQHMVAETCSCSLNQAASLADYIMQVTDGNPFFITEFLKSLYAEGLLNFDVQSGQWRWDLSQIQDTHLPDDVVELMAGKIQKLSANAQQSLKLAACIGNQFDVKTLAIISDSTPAAIAANLWQGVQAGLILSLGSSYQFIGLEEAQREDTQNNNLDLAFKFLHDRVQQAAYSLIPEADKQNLHYRIGRSLLTHTPPEAQEEKIFDIVNQLNIGISLIAQQAERNELAALNLIAGNRAKESSAYDAALRYLLMGSELLEQNSWQTQYELTLALHEAAAETAYLNADFEQVERLVDRILLNARNVLDQVKAYQVRIFAYSAQNNLDAALDTYTVAVKQLGEPVIRYPNRLQVGLELIRTRFFVIGDRLERLESLPPMTNPYKLGVMKIAGSMIMAANNVAPLFTAVAALRIVNLVMKYGSSAQSSVQGVAYGVMLRVGLLDIERAYEFGRMSLRLLDRLNAKQYKTLTILGYETCLRHWKEPLRSSLPTLLSAYTEGLELGNLEAASLVGSVYCFHLFFLGESLATVADAYEQYIAQFKQFGQELTVFSMLPWHQLTLHLQGFATQPDRLVGTAFNEDEMLPHFIDDRLGIPLFYTYIAKLIWLYHAGNYPEAIRAAQLAEPYQESSPVTTPYANLFFYWSLACLAHYSSASKALQKRYLKQVNKNQRKAKQWVKHCRENYRHRYDLVEAERFRILGDYTKAMEYYDRAIQGAKTQEYGNEEALANELTAKFYLNLDKERIAQVYLLEARYAYLRWGATYKVDVLNTLYPALLDRSLEHSSFDPTVTQSTSSSSRRSSGSSSNLDLDTVIQAAQAISGEIVLDRLLENLLKLVIENAGAQKGCLLLMHQDELRIEAAGQIDQPQPISVQTVPLTGSVTLPLSLINYVQRTRENVVLRDATQEGLFTTDPYIIEMQPRSLLCSPILNQGNLTGILYLENNLATDAFTPERVTVLNILSAQAAIALENARFYRTLEQKVEDRTAELGKANQEITLLNERLKSENLRMGAELSVTRQLQQMILPKDHELSQIKELDIAGFMEPADEVGGDYYDVLQSNGSIKIGIGDITGHGLESGVVMLMVQTAVRTLLETQEMDSTRFLSTLNRVIYDNVQRMDTDRNLSLALLDYRAGHVRLSGQHEETLVVRANNTIERLDTIDLGFPVGLVDDITDFIHSLDIYLEPGDGVVLYTDGIVEAANMSGELYGLDRLCQVVGKCWPRSAQEIRHIVIEDVRSHIGEQKVFDDITLLVIKQR